MNDERERTLFAMTSITYASKAQSLLRKNGFGCEIVKTPKDLAKGCGYSIKVTGNGQQASALLGSYGIMIKASRRL